MLHGNHLPDCPNMVRDSGFHGRSHAQCLVNPAKVVVHVVNGNGVSVVLDLLRESVCQPREPSHAHSHGKILALDATGRDVLGVGPASNNLPLRPKTLGGAIADLLLVRSVDFNQHGVIDIASESALDRIKISPMAIRCELNAV